MSCEKCKQGVSLSLYEQNDSGVRVQRWSESDGAWENGVKELLGVNLNDRFRLLWPGPGSVEDRVIGEVSLQVDSILDGICNYEDEPDTSCDPRTPQSECDVRIYLDFTWANTGVYGLSEFREVRQPYTYLCNGIIPLTSNVVATFEQDDTIHLLLSIQECGKGENISLEMTDHTNPNYSNPKFTINLFAKCDECCQSVVMPDPDE